jgi:hypothetical protein
MKNSEYDLESIYTDDIASPQCKRCWKLVKDQDELDAHSGRTTSRQHGKQGAIGIHSLDGGGLLDGESKCSIR